MAEETRVYTVPLAEAYMHKKSMAARRAVKELRKFLSRHMKAEKVVISNALNSYIWSRGMFKPPRRVRIKAIKDGSIVRAYLPDEKIEEKKEKEKKEGKKVEEKVKEKEKKEEKKEEKPKVDKKEKEKGEEKK